MREPSCSSSGPIAADKLAAARAAAADRLENTGRRVHCIWSDELVERSSIAVDLR